MKGEGKIWKVIFQADGKKVAVCKDNDGAFTSESFDQCIGAVVLMEKVLGKNFFLAEIARSEKILYFSDKHNGRETKNITESIFTKPAKGAQGRW